MTGDVAYRSAPLRFVAFDVPRGTGFARHRHDTHQLLSVESGALAVGTDAEHWAVPARRGVWLPADLDHELVAVDDARVTFAYIVDPARRRRADRPCRRSGSWPSARCCAKRWGCWPGRAGPGASGGPGSRRSSSTRWPTCDPRRTWWCCPVDRPGPGGRRRAAGRSGRGPQPRRAGPGGRRQQPHAAAAVPVRDRADLPAVAAAGAGAELDGPPGRRRVGHHGGAPVRVLVGLGVHRRVPGRDRDHPDRLACAAGLSAPLGPQLGPRSDRARLDRTIATGTSAWPGARSGLGRSAQTRAIPRKIRTSPCAGLRSGP